MPFGLQFGRRIRVTVGGIVVANVDPAEPEASATRSLDVTFTTEAHTKLQPMGTTVTVIGLNRDIRRRLAQQQKAAASLAWQEYQAVATGAVAITDEEFVLQAQQQLVFNGLQVRIEAGYQDDFALIANAQALPNGIKPNTNPAGVPTTTIEAQDGRYPWQNGFVDDEVAPGVQYRQWEAILEAGEGFLDGTITADVIEQKYPELLQRKNFAGYLNGRVLAGDTAALQEQVAETLGLTRFFDRGQIVFLDLDAVTQDEAVILRLPGKSPPGGNGTTNPAPGGLLTYSDPDNRGFVQARCLLNHRLTPGRQVILQDERAKPIGEGVFRVDYVKHSGSTYGQEFNSDVLLRPVTISRARNV